MLMRARGCTVDIESRKNPKEKRDDSRASSQPFLSLNYCSHVKDSSNVLFSYCYGAIVFLGRKVLSAHAGPLDSFLD